MCVYIYILIFGCSIYDYIYIHMLESIGKVMISQTHFKTPKLKILGKWFETLNWTMNFINHENIGKASINVYISNPIGIIWILLFRFHCHYCFACVCICVLYVYIYTCHGTYIHFIFIWVASRSSTLLLHCSSLRSRRIDGSDRWLAWGGSMVS